MKKQSRRRIVCVELMGKASHTLARLATAYADAGNIAEADAVLKEMHEIAEHRHISDYHLHWSTAALGRIEEALDLLERAYETRDARVLWMGVDPGLDPLHGHPRFNDLLRKLNHRLASLPAVSPSVARRSGVDRGASFPRSFGPPGENTGDEYLGVGIDRRADHSSQQLCNVLLCVRPAACCVTDGAAIDPLAAGRDLGVDYVVDGSLRRVGNRIARYGATTECQ